MMQSRCLILADDLKVVNVEYVINILFSLILQVNSLKHKAFCQKKIIKTMKHGSPQTQVVNCQASEGIKQDNYFFFSQTGNQVFCHFINRYFFSLFFQMLKYVGPEGGHLKANISSSGTSNVVVTQVSISMTKRSKKLYRFTYVNDLFYSVK